MKNLQKAGVIFGFLIIFSSCQPNVNSVQILANKDARLEIMDSIANSNELMTEMMSSILNNKKGSMMMQNNQDMHRRLMEDRQAMIKIMEENPTLLKAMMEDMIYVSKNDTTLMTSLCRSIVENHQMMGRIQNMQESNRNKKDNSGW